MFRVFQEEAHGLPKNAEVKRISKPEREDATRWLDDYGFDQAVWMVRRCIELHNRARRGADTLFRFKALGFYEAKAMADFEISEKKQAELPFEESKSVEEAWDSYRFQEVEKARENLSPQELVALEALAQSEVEVEMNKARLRTPRSALNAIVQAKLEEMLVAKVDGLTEEEFFRQWKPS